MESLDHHKKADVATDRPAYRDARWDRAVKVYTVNQESKYLLIQNVHALGVTQELLQQAALYGPVDEYRILGDYPSEPYTEVYWIKFVNIDHARVAKRKMDNRSFFGKNLHVCYAPEYESPQDTREKLRKRREVIARKTRVCGPKLTVQGSSSSSTSHNFTSLSSSQPTHDLPTVPSLLSHDDHMPPSAFQSHDDHMPPSALQSHGDHMPPSALQPPLPLPPSTSSILETPWQPKPLVIGGKTHLPITRGDCSSPRMRGCGPAARGKDVRLLSPSSLSKEERMAAYLGGGDGTISCPNTILNQVKRTALDSGGCTSSTASSSSQHLSQIRLTTSVPERQTSAQSCSTPVEADKTKYSALSPPMSGNSSVDASIGLAREKMKKVFEPVVDSSLYPLLKHKPKKRKRI